MHIGADGGTRTHTPFREQRPQRCGSTKFPHVGNVLLGAHPRTRTGNIYVLSVTRLPIAPDGHYFFRFTERLKQKRRTFRIRLVDLSDVYRLHDHSIRKARARLEGIFPRIRQQRAK